MNVSEAIERIKNILEEATGSEDAVCYVTDYDADSLRMAIDALEKQEGECVKPIRFPYGNRPREGICGYCHRGTFLFGSMYTNSQYCGCGGICDYCENNHIGRPCVRALNAKAREKRIEIDYNDRDFEKWFYL